MLENLCDMLKNCLGCFASICDLGCIDQCGTIVIQKTVNVLGEYALVYEFNGRTYRVTKVFEVGQTLDFQMVGLNEDYSYTAKIEQPDGTVMVFNDGVQECQAFRFRTNPSGQNAKKILMSAVFQ